MNQGVVISNKKWAWIKQEGSLCERDWLGKYEFTEFNSGIGKDYFPTNHKCVVTFCEDVSCELKKMLLAMLKTRFGHINFFVSDIHKIIFAGSYSVPKQKQICLSLSESYAQIFIFENGHIYNKSCIRLQKPLSFQIKKAYDNTITLSLSEIQTYIFDLGNYQTIESLTREMSILIKTVDKNITHQGVICFIRCPDKYRELLSSVEFFTKLPLVTINTDFHSIQKHMIEVVKDRNIFDYVIKIS